MPVRFLLRALALLPLLAVRPAAAQQPRGHLFIVGGGTQPDSLVARFVGGTSAGAAVMSDSMLTGNQHPAADCSAITATNFPRSRAA